MKIGIVIQSNDPETVWNAFRFANTSLNSNHTVKTFLLGKGVEVEQIRSDKFDVQSVIKTFLAKKGELQACGTCLESRNTEIAVCPPSTMGELLRIVEESDKVLVF
jgi:sulfur relay (sulfurtransferase) complex TusBCD TusD component (DsrE family)